MSRQHLAINVSENFIQFSILEADKVCIQFGSPYTGKTELDRKESVQAFMKERSELASDFENITLAWCHSLSTLVPNSIFTETTPQDIFTLCFGKEAAEQTIDYNRMYELSLINVYAIPDWIKSLFVIKYPRILIQHAGTHLIREAMHKNAFYTKSTLVLMENYFRMTIAKHNALEFYSSFDYQSAEDIIYHLNFVLQQKELLNEKGSITIALGPNSNRENAEKVLAGLNRIHNLHQMEISIEEDYLTKSQLLCV